MARPLLLTALALSAAAAATQACAQSTPYGAGDRYGPGPAPSTPSGYGQVAAPGPAPALRGRVLAWPGKVEPRAMATAAAVAAPPVVGAAYAWRGPTPPTPNRQSDSSQAYARPAPEAVAPWRSAAGAAPSWGRFAPPARGDAIPISQARAASSPATAGAADGWRPVFAGATPAPGQAPARQSPPTSIYAAPTQAYSPTLAAARAPAPNRALAADRRYGYDPTQNHSVRFYSVARPFGLRPDPAPIPPQFFTATADLGGDPPGPLPVNHTTATQRAAVVGGSGGDSGGQ